MPQMAPTLWFPLYLSVLVTLLIINSMMFFKVGFISKADQSTSYTLTTLYWMW